MVTESLPAPISRPAMTPARRVTFTVPKVATGLVLRMSSVRAAAPRCNSMESAWPVAITDNSTGALTPTYETAATELRVTVPEVVDVPATAAIVWATELA